MLIAWSRAVVFAELNGIPWRSYGWSAFRPGPWLRREARKRLYHGLFRPNLSLFQMAVTELKIRRARSVLFDPELAKMDISEHLVVFRRFPRGPDFFAGLHEHTELLKWHFDKLLTPAIHQAMAGESPVSIACHIRRGDFIAPGDPRYTVGGKYCQTPNEFYRDSILAIRSQAGEILPATVFSNGHSSELEELLQMDGVTLAQPRSDLVDLLRMSRADYLVTSAWSSFSYLAGFLGNATMIRPPYAESCPIRSSSTTAFEGTLSEFIEQSVKERAAA